MTRIGIALLALVAGSAIAAAVLAHRSEAAPAAEIQRTFVSTSGNDANPCTRAEPCRNFAAAIANTFAGGEVVALDSGGYGTFSVDKEITIAGAPGAHVAITAFSGNAVTVNAGVDDTIVLRNLYLTGLGASRGVLFQAGGSLHVENVVASGFTQLGLYAFAVDAHLVVVNSRFRHNGTHGVLTDQPLTVELDGVRADRNGAAGVFLTNGAEGTLRHCVATRNGDTGFGLSTGTRITIVDSVSDSNAVHGVLVNGTSPVANLVRVVLSNNAAGGLNTNSASSTAWISDSTVTGNTNGLWESPGTIETYGDSLVRGNTTNTFGTITAVAKT